MATSTTTGTLVPPLVAGDAYGRAPHPDARSGLPAWFRADLASFMSGTGLTITASGTGATQRDGAGRGPELSLWGRSAADGSWSQIGGTIFADNGGNMSQVSHCPAGLFDLLELRLDYAPPLMSVSVSGSIQVTQ